MSCDVEIPEAAPRTFLQFIEISRLSASRSRYYSLTIISLYILIAAYTAVVTFGHRSGRLPVDFDIFYVAGKLTWSGSIEKAYQYSTFVKIQESFYGGPAAFIPWTYPPQFDLLLAPLALLPLSIAYAVFTFGTLAVFLMTLKRIAGEYFTTILMVVFPAIVICIRCGQNGLLTGALTGLICLGLSNGSRLAGLPLGLMIIKPHLAVSLAFYVLIDRRWGTALVAATVLAATSALATIAFGENVWTAFLNGAAEAAGFLEQGFYPLFRMVSAFAASFTLGYPAYAGFIAQALVAGVALIIVVVAKSKFSVRQAIGLTAFVSVLISPYAYDYDLPIVAMGFALLTPDLIRLGSGRERLAIYCLMLFACGFSAPQAFIQEKVATAGQENSLSLAALSLLAILALSIRILSRDRVASGFAAENLPPPNNALVHR